MSRLALPLSGALQDGFDESDVQRVWRGVMARSARRSAPATGVRWVLPRAAVVLAGVIIVLAGWHWYATGGPLGLAGGGRPPSQWVVASSEPKRWVDFADGSRIGLDPGARLDLLGNTEDEFLTALREGEGTFAVKPGGSRRWVVECGLVTVEVLGTDFSVERSAGQVRVSVSSGVVLVRGERVPDRVQRVRAGERLVISAPDESGSGDQPSPGHGASVDEPARSTSSASPQVSSAEANAMGAPLAAASPRQTGRAGTDFDELVKQADAARRAGDSARAVALLERAVRVGGKDPRTAIAALTLARLTMNDSPSRAARALTTALASGAPRGLEEDAMARLVEARARSGDREGAERAAREYERRYPTGARRAEVKRWSAE